MFFCFLLLLDLLVRKFLITFKTGLPGHLSKNKTVGSKRNEMQNEIVSCAPVRARESIRNLVLQMKSNRNQETIPLTFFQNKSEMTNFKNY